LNELCASIKLLLLRLLRRLRLRRRQTRSLRAPMLQPVHKRQHKRRQRLSTAKSQLPLPQSMQTQQTQPERSDLHQTTSVAKALTLSE
jgi:DNA polymerase III psi subunit